MARYWIYLNDEVAGPFAVEQLIRQRGFARNTLVCVDDASGKPTHWTSPAEIPELAHIFKAADEHMAAAPAAPTPKAPPKAPARPPRPYTPAVTLKAPSRSLWSSLAWFTLAALLVAGGAYFWFQNHQRGVLSSEQQAAQALVQNARLPASSLFGTLQQYLQEKEIKPRWDIERIEDALYHVTASWYPSSVQPGSPALTVYSFEANVQAQTVRGLNSAAATLLSTGFPPPPSLRAKPPPAVKKSPVEMFSPALESRREAFEAGDFPTVWNFFSQRKKAEMSKGGVSRDGFLRLQSLTHRVDTAMKQTVVKSKAESDTGMLVLIKQAQAGRPDIFIKQLWAFEDGAWKLDDEEKRVAAATPSSPSLPSGQPVQPASPAGAPDAAPPATAPSTASPRNAESPAANPPVAPAALPGMSH